MFFLWITGVFKWRTVHAYFATLMATQIPPSMATSNSPT